LYQSLLFSAAHDTDLVCFAPEDVLPRLPDGPQLVKVRQAPHELAPAYGFINSIACFNGAGSEVLERYGRILKTDVDTFITPAWNGFRPAGFVCGTGAYVHSQDVRDRLEALSARLGYVHRGRHNLGATLFGDTARVRRVCDDATRITEHLLTVEFASEHGQWPEWFRGVASMYATEIALNHHEPELEHAPADLDFPSHSPDEIAAHAHIHCWYTTGHYSKHKWIDGLYPLPDEAQLDMGRIPDYCLAMAARAARRAP
jgi:hypothetical protein